MEKSNIIEFVKRATKEAGTEAETIMLTTVNGSDTKTFVTGVDPLCMNRGSIALAAAMHSTLNKQLGIADAIYNSLREKGKVKEIFHEDMMMDADSEKESRSGADIENEEKKKSNGKKDDREAVVDALIGLLETVFGGDDDEDDD